MMRNLGLTVEYILMVTIFNDFGRMLWVSLSYFIMSNVKLLKNENIQNCECFIQIARYFHQINILNCENIFLESMTVQHSFYIPVHFLIMEFFFSD